MEDPSAVDWQLPLGVEHPEVVKWGLTIEGVEIRNLGGQGGVRPTYHVELHGLEAYCGAALVGPRWAKTPATWCKRCVYRRRSGWPLGR